MKDMRRLKIQKAISKIPLDMKEFRRIMGFGEVMPPPFDHIFESVSTALQMGTARAEALIFDHDEVEMQKSAIVIKGIPFDTGSRVANWLKHCTGAALFICTLGIEFEQQMKSLQNDPVEAWFADAIGSLKCEAFADMVHRQIGEEVSKEGLSMTNRNSPGYCNWSVGEQQKLFTFFRQNSTGITINSSSLMSPIKSISALAGIGKKVKKTPYICDVCTDSHCAYRKAPQSNKK